VISVLQLLVGIVSLAVASYIFWRIGQEDGISPRWRNVPGMEVLIVAVVLGGWAAGGSFVIYAIVKMAAG